MAKGVGRERVRAKIKEVVARILQHELKDPRMGFVTVIDCALSPDYRHATIKVSILAEREAETRKILKMLEDARGYVQRGVAGSLRTRVTPELRFELDRGAEKSIRISNLLDELAKERQTREGGEAAGPADAEVEAEEAEALAGDEDEEFDGDLWEEYEGDADDEDEDDDEGQ